MKKTLNRNFKKSLAIVIAILQLMGLFTVSFSVNAAPEANRVTAVSSEVQNLSNGVSNQNEENQNANQTDNQSSLALRIFLIIFIVAVMVFVLCGYVFFKKWLPAKIKYQNYNSNRIIRPYKKLSTYASVLVPFLSVTAYIGVDYFDIDDNNCNVVFKIKARTSQNAEILNALEVYNNCDGLYVDSDARLSQYCKALMDGRHFTHKPECMLVYNGSQIYADGTSVVSFGGEG